MAMVPTAGRAVVRFIARTLRGVKTAPFPGFIEPCKPTLRPKPPVGDKWQYEIKFDGYRTQLHLRGGNATVFTSSGLDWTDKFATIADAAKQIPANHAVLDGEVVVQNEEGIPDLARCAPPSAANGIGCCSTRSTCCIWMVSICAVQRSPIAVACWAMLLGKQPGRISMSKTIDEPGDVLLQHACQMGLEGIVAKRVDAPYRSGRVESWIKVKCLKAMRLAVIGCVPAKGNSIAALRLARRAGGELVYAGKVGTGFSVRAAQSVRDRLEPLMRKTPPTAKPLNRPDTTWVEPTVEADIACMDLTDDGMVRHASFKGLKP